MLLGSKAQTRRTTQTRLTTHHFRHITTKDDAHDKNLVSVRLYEHIKMTGQTTANCMLCTRQTLRVCAAHEDARHTDFDAGKSSESSRRAWILEDPCHFDDHERTSTIGNKSRMNVRSWVCRRTSTTKGT